MSDANEVRDKLAKEYVDSIQMDLLTRPYGPRLGFKAGWDAALKHHPVVKQLVEALEFECSNRCAQQNPCNAREMVEAYRKATDGT
jgi:hypothetical protein